MGYSNPVRKRYAIGLAVMSLAAILGPGCGGGGGTGTSNSTGSTTTVGAGGSTSTTTTGAGGAGGASTTTTTTTTSTTTTGSGAGGAGGGGTGGAGGGAAKPGHAGTELVSAGQKASSPSYKMRFTLGQPSQNQGATTSPSYRIQGGLVGANGSLP